MTLLRRVKGLARGRLAIATLAVALALAAVVGLVLVSGPTATVIFEASPAGSINPSGTQTLRPGTVVDVIVRANDPAWEPGLMVDAGPVVLTRREDGAYRYRLTVDRDHHLQATFAELADNVRQLDPATAQALVEIAPDDSRLVFSHSTELLDSLVVGDILTNRIDDGLGRPLLVRVRAIERRGGQLVLATEPAVITDVVKNASVSVLLPLRLPARQGGDRAPQIANLGGPFLIEPPPLALEAGTEELHVDVGVDLDDQQCGRVRCKVRAEGEVNARFAVGINLEISFFDVRRFEIFFLSDEDATLRVEGSAGLNGKKRIPLLTTDFVQILLMVGLLPVWLTPGADVSVGGSWELAAEARGEATLTGHQKIGARLEAGGWSPIGEHSEEVSGDVTVGGTARLDAYLGLEPRVSIYRFCDVSIDFQALYAELEADTREVPWWTLYGGVRLTGVTAKCTFVRDYKYEFELGIRRVLLQAAGAFLATGVLPSPSATAGLTTGKPSAASSLSPTPSPTPSPTSTATPTPPAGFEVPSVAEVVTDSLRVRSKPEVSAASIRLTPLLDAPIRLAILDGPVYASGYEWYLVHTFDLETSFVPINGARPPLPFGWVAAAGRDGEPWIAPVDPECPARPTTLKALAALPKLIGLVCFSGAPITVDAVPGQCGDFIEFGDFLEPGWFNLRSDIDFYAPGTPSGPGFDCGLLPALDPQARRPPGTLTDLYGSTVRVTGMFDHPDARSCTFTPFDSDVVIDGREGTVPCRQTFVVTAVEQ